MGITRRNLLKAGAASVALAGMGLPKISVSADRTVRIGFLAPLTGEVAGWGLPGLNGCEIWADWVNANGGVDIRGEPHQVELVSFDNEYLPDRALQGYRRLLQEDVKFIMMLGGDTWPAVQRLSNQRRMLTSTLLPSDLSPDTPYLVAPCEVHPIYNVTGVDWLARNRPNAKRVAMCAQDDALGRPSVATYNAAFEAHGLEVVHMNWFDIETTDFAPIMTAMLRDEPDVLCLDTAYSDFVALLCEQAYDRGFDGEIISCTFDNYPAIIDRTSREFVEGLIFQFPDFDDPALDDPRINFNDPNGFFEEYQARYPGTWTAVSWEYASILDLWKAAAELAGSVEPTDVLEAMKAGGRAPHAFGEASWWGEELFGIDNALVGDWPVVVMQNGRARIQEYGNIPTWWDRHGDILVKHMEEMGEMWYQRS